MTTHNKFRSKYGPWAVVTGASGGMGEHFARQLAKRGLNVVLVARREDRLAHIAKNIEREYGVSARVIPADLATLEGISALKAKTADLDVGLLINNAGREDSGRFVDAKMADALTTLDLNIRSPMLLSHHFAQLMIKRRSSGIIFLSSIVAFQGVPFVANYAATKAYDLIFAESLAAELAPDGVDVLAVAPGFTQTDLSPDFDFSGVPMKPMFPAKVVRAALDSLGKRRLAVPGLINKFLYYSGKYMLPRAVNSAAFGKVFTAVLHKKLGTRPTEAPQNESNLAKTSSNSE